MKIYKPFFVFLLLVGLGLLGFTTYKLYAMLQIRGWIPGAQVTTCYVTAKFEDLWTRIQKNGTFTLDCPDLVRVPGHRVQLSLQRWLSTSVGDALPIVKVGGLFSEELYVQGDLGSSDGDFAIDTVFLGAEGLVILMAIWALMYKPRRTAMQELFPGNTSTVRRYRR